MGNWTNQATAARMRDLITNVAENAIKRLRPEPRIGKVFEVNPQVGQATVLFAGESYPDLTYVRFGANMIPSVAMIDTFETLGIDAPGDLVRVSGSPGRYYIDGFISGRPRTIIGREAGLPIGPVDGQFYYDESRGEVMYWDEVAGIAIPAIGDTGWIPFTYTNGWTDYGAGWEPGAYKRFNGWTILRGLIKPPASANTQMFIIPEKFRPGGTGTLMFSANSNLTTGTQSAGTAHTHVAGSVASRLSVIPTTGVCSPGITTIDGHYSLSGIQWIAEQ